MPAGYGVGQISEEITTGSLLLAVDDNNRTDCNVAEKEQQPYEALQAQAESQRSSGRHYSHAHLGPRRPNDCRQNTHIKVGGANHAGRSE